MRKPVSRVKPNFPNSVCRPGASFIPPYQRSPRVGLDTIREVAMRLYYCLLTERGCGVLSEEAMVYVCTGKCYRKGLLVGRSDFAFPLIS
jgi:hypothetical protein